MPRLPSPSISGKLLLIFATLFVVVAVSSGIGLFQVRQVQEASDWTAHTFDVIEVADEVRGAMLDQQTGLRGFIESGRAEFLEPYVSGRERVGAQVAALDRLTADNAVQQARIVRLREAIDAWWAEYADLRIGSAGLGRTEDDALALAGKRRMDEVKAILADIAAEERRLLDERSARQRDAFRTAYLATAVGGVLLLLVAVAGWLVLGRGLARPILSMSGQMLRLAEDDLDIEVAGLRRSDEIGAMARALQTFKEKAAHRLELQRAKEQADRDLARNEARLRTIFDTVGEGILTCDMAGVVTSANGTVAMLLDLPETGIIGRPVGDFLRDAGGHAGPLDLDRLFGTEGTRTLEVVAVRADGNTFAAEITAARARGAAGGLHTLTVRDIAARRAVERAKDEFVSTVSHELRTPLTSISGSLGLLAGGAAGPLPEKARHLVEIARKNSERLVRLINDILDIEKIESGRIEFRYQAVDLVRLVEQAVEQDRPFADRLGISLEAKSEVETMEVVVDPARIGQVLSNLLSNAAKFSPAGAAVVVSVERRGAAARVSVTDRGPGIPVEFRQRVFDRFAQADGSDTRKVGGTGLGLSIARGIAERHGGGLGFETEMGVGTTFHLDLPLPAPVPARAEAGPQVGRDRVLVCEDDPDLAQLIRLVVQQEGFAADVAASAAEAERFLAHASYAVMTLDLGLPDRSGLDLVRTVRADPRTAEMPIVVVSGSVGDEEVTPLFRVVDWLGKPIDLERLVRSIRDAASLPRRSTRAGLPEVLHVEDDPDTAQLVRLSLDGIARVTSVATLDAARRQLGTGSFDLLLLDVGLPDGSGLELLPSVESLGGRPLPVIVFSALDVDGGMIGRVEHALTKSRADMTDLVGMIRSVLNRADSGRDAAAPQEPVHAR
jgi:PAS domain S-box-containing protein